MKNKSLLLTATLLLLLLISVAPSLANSKPDLSQPLSAVRLPTNADPTLSEGALMVIDYGAFKWAIFPQSAERTTQNEQAQSYDIILGDGPIDMSATQAAARQISAETRDFYLLQLIGPTKQSWLDAIEASGAEIVQYIHPFTYVVYGDGAAIGNARSAEFIRWSSHFSAEYRQPPQSDSLQSSATRTYRILIYSQADRKPIDAALASIGQTSAEFSTLNATWETASVDINQNSADMLAQIPGIFSIQAVSTDGGLRGEMSNQMLLRAFDASNNIQTGYQSWLTTAGVTGNNVIVASVDNGIDDDHPDLINRMADCNGSSCGKAAEGTNSHGTHTAAIIAADGSSGTKLNGFIRALGVAPGATLVEQVYQPFYLDSGGMLTLMQQSVQNGAVISANSWGPAATPKGYDMDTMQVDIGVRDADSSQAGNQALTYVLSFMNGFGGSQTQGSPDEAKNTITVGSTYLQNSGSGTQMTDIFDLSSNSAHGPALDGRMIPHLVAPGCDVDSAYNNNSYGMKCGTSMASPHISGAAALFYEKYLTEFNEAASPALIKAAFAVAAESLAGHEDADGGILGQPFDSKQGWGLFDLAQAITPSPPVFYLNESVIFNDTGTLSKIELESVDPTEPVRIMLAWTDAPGAGMGGTTPAWVNDLNLSVVLNGSTYAGNQFDANGLSVASTSYDGKNNTEGVFFAPMAAGTALDLNVIAANLAGDGVPNNSDTTDQDFAIVCYNCKIRSGTVTVSLGLQQATSSPSSIGGILAAFTIGSIVTYSITRTLKVSGTTAMTTTLSSQPEAGLEILTDTIMVNGIARPDSYDPLSAEINLTDSHFFPATGITQTKTTYLTYQAKITTAAVNKGSLTNIATATAHLPGETHEQTASKTISLLRQIWLPFIRK